MEHRTLHIEGMSCGGCVKSVRRILEKQPGVTQVESVEIGEARIAHDGTEQDLDEILASLARAQFPARAEK